MIQKSQNAAGPTSSLLLFGEDMRFDSALGTDGHTHQFRQ